MLNLCVMTRKQPLIMRLIAILIFSSWVFSSWVYASPTIVTQSITLDGQRLPLSDPIIQTDDGIYGPLRALADTLGAQLTYTRKTRLHTLQTATNIPLTLKAYSRAFWVNHRLQYTPVVPIRYQNQVYIPLSQFLPPLGYTVSHTETGTVAIATQPDFRTHSAAHRVTQPFDFNRLANTPIHTLYLNETPTKKPLTHTQNSIAFIAINSILANHGYQVSRTDSHVQYSQNNRTITLSTQTPTARVSNSLHATPYQTEAPALVSKNTVYIPLSTLHSVFDYSLVWEQKSHVLHLLNPIQPPAIMPLSVPIQLTIDHTHAPTKQPLVQYSKNSVTITLATSVFNEAGDERYPSDYALTQVRWKSYPRSDSPHSTIRLDFSAPHHVEAQTIGHQTRIIAKPIVSAIHQRILYNDGAEIQIATTGPIHQNYRISSSNSVIRVHLPSTHLAPQIVESESHYYDTIVVSGNQIKIPIRSKIPQIFPEFGNQLTIRFQPNPDQELNKKIVLSSPPLANRSIQKEPLNRRIIAIDPGHGGSDPGAIGLYGIHEKDYNRDISDHLMRLLRQSGARVVNLRLSDRNPSLASRSSEANASNADITVSVHVNSFYKEYANGTESYFYKWKDRRLATALQSAMTRELKLKDNGVKRAKMYILNHTRMPAALVEPAFMTNRNNAKKLKNPEFRARIAQSIHDGIVDYFKSEN